MRAITLWEPYAMCIAIGAKKVETRSWATKYRGPLLIHAAKRQITGEQLALWNSLRSNGHKLEPNYGCVVAIAQLTGCVQMNTKLIERQSDLEIVVGDWQIGRYAWILENIRPLPPTPAKGGQGLWIPTEDLLPPSHRTKPLQLSLF